MFSITDLKKGTLFQINGEPFRVTDYNQKVMGRGGSIVNVKIKSLLDGKVLERTFKGSEQLEPANVNTKKVQFLYKHGSQLNFMDTVSYEQYEVNTSIASGQDSYLKEGDEANALFFGGQIVGLELPKNVDLKVVYAEDAIKGDTSGAITKIAELETGVKIKVPAFIKIGDKISVDTTTGAYRTRTTGSK